MAPPMRPNVRFGSKADMCGATAHVRFVPKADIHELHSRSNNWALPTTPSRHLTRSKRFWVNRPSHHFSWPFQ
jgi:hypothetical protein